MQQDGTIQPTVKHLQMVPFADGRSLFIVGFQPHPVNMLSFRMSNNHRMLLCDEIVIKGDTVFTLDYNFHRNFLIKYCDHNNIKF